MTKDDILREFRDVNFFYNDCCKYDTLSKMLDELTDNYRECGRWIPVSERLPKKNVEVLATTKWGEVTIAEMYSANDWFIHEDATNAKTNGIVAWMPLPEPYRAESEERE